MEKSATHRIKLVLGLTPASPESPETVIQQVTIPIQSDLDIINARQTGRKLAATLGFSTSELTLIATSISELARNIVMYANRGEIELQLAENSDHKGVVVIARDEGPGIADIKKALQDGYSTSRSLGLGLPGVKRLMDEMDIKSEAGKGTLITVKKWIRLTNR